MNLSASNETEVAPATQARGPRMRPCVVVHYHEVGLKGRNRPFFLGTLEKNLHRATAGLGVKTIERASGRILLWLEPDTAWEPLRERIAGVYGVVNLRSATRCNPSSPS